MSVARLLVEVGRSGRPVLEDVPAKREGDRWRLLASPGLAMGVAAGDLLEVGEDHSFEVVERGGNVAVHVGAPAGAQAQLDRLKGDLEGLGGWCDGTGWTSDRSSSLTVFTIPHRAGFESIQAACNRYQQETPGGEWYYVNVYDPADDTTPLNWWLG